MQIRSKHFSELLNGKLLVTDIGAHVTVVVAFFFLNLTLVYLLIVGAEGYSYAAHTQ
jgi:hypothetical protein